nr:MAG TPA: hypothetical protein [Herelleviridae sp.]
MKFMMNTDNCPLTRESSEHIKNNSSPPSSVSPFP